MTKKNKFERFLDDPKDVPFLAGAVSGIYPFLFFYSNNYPAVNTWKHAGFFFLLYVVSTVIVIVTTYTVFTRIEKLRPYRRHLLFVLPFMVMSAMLSYVMYETFKKKILLGLLIVLCLLSIKLYNHYKRLLVLVILMALLPIFKIGIHLYEDLRPMHWAEQKDNILDAMLKHKPNIYMLQPDGYTGKELMEQSPYSYDNSFYRWLENNGFTVYKNFRSNYPASLTSNASMFAMKHHYFDDVLFPAIEMPKARKANVDNNVVRIFKKNGYKSYFLAEDEYFQQNLCTGNYDFYNLATRDIPLLTKGEKLAREVYGDLEKAVNDSSKAPKFVFVEKVLPHHIHFDGTGAAAERREYLQQTEKANEWLKKAVALIESKDKNALIIILSDHGGWVGNNDSQQFYTTTDERLIRSTFGNLAAIRWNGVSHTAYDGNLKTNVNVFRVLFACLSENSSYLNHLEKDESYQIRYGNFFDGVYKLIDENGRIVREKR